MSLRRGDVVYVNFPRPSDATGRVQSGRRPAVVLNATDKLSQIPVVLVVPGTSRIAAVRFPHTCQVTPTDGNGLSAPTVFLAFQLQAVDRNWLAQSVGRLGESDLRALENEVLEVLGFDPPDDN